MCFGATNLWARRWITFFVVLVAFFAALIVAYANLGVAGRIVDAKTGACLHVDGNADNYFLTRSFGDSCKQYAAVLVMEEDMDNSPLIWHEPDTGRMLCVTNRQNEERVTLEPCADGQENQLWSSYNGKIVSIVAKSSNNPKQCLSGPTSAASLNREVVMAECKVKTAQTWGFKRGLVAPL
jgi:hypothetical protein